MNYNFNRYIFFVISMVLLMVAWIENSKYQILYTRDFAIYDTKPDPALEPLFLKNKDFPEMPEPITFSEDDGCIGYREEKILAYAITPHNVLLKQLGNAIDSLQLNKITYRSIKIVLNKKTTYQNVIDILDLFDRKQSKIYAVVKDSIYWYATE